MARTKQQQKAVIVTGGYGSVGSRVVRNLAQHARARVVVAGRDGSRARDFADEVGAMVSNRRIDVDSPDSVSDGLRDAGLIINCAPQQGEPQLAAAAARDGIAYLDLTSDYRSISQMLELDDTARESGGRMLLCCGLAPGLSNLMARSAVAEVVEPNRITTHLWWQMGPRVSPTVRQQLADLSTRFPVMQGAYDRTVCNFARSRRTTFPAPAHEQREYTYCLADQFFYPDTLGVPESSSWLSLGSGTMGKVLSGLARSRMTGLMGRSALKGLIRRAVGQIPDDTADRWILMVDVAGAEGTRRMIAQGRELAESAAVLASEMASRLLKTCRKPGVWMPEEVLTLDDLARRLRLRDITLQTAETR